MADLEHTDAHANKVMPKIRVSNLNLGNQIDLLSAGVWIQGEAKANGKNFISPSVFFDDLTAGTSCLAPYITQLLPQTPINTDESGEFNGTSKIFYQSTPESSIAQKYYIKGGATTATADINIKFYKGTSAGDIVPDNLVFEGEIPFADWPTVGAEAGFELSDIGINNSIGVSHVGFQQGVGTIAVFSSASPFSLKTNAGQNELWYKVDFHIITEVELLDKYTTRTPFIDLQASTVDFPLVAGDNILNILASNDSSEFTLVDSSTYRYDGITTAKFDGISSFSCVSNASNCEVRFDLVINRVGGGTDRYNGPNREFDSTNEGNVGFPTTAYLDEGDELQIILNSNKLAPNFDITFFNKTVRKVN